MSVVGLVIALALLIFMAMRNVHIVVGAVVSSVILAIFSGLAPVEAMTGPYMKTFAEYIQDFFLIFLLGAIFGRLMGDTGAAESIAHWFARTLGAERAVLAIVLACAVLTYGGVSLFVVGFAVFPIALSLFYEGNVPRRFIPGALAFGSVTFTMTSAGSPEIQNLIPIEYLDTTPTAGLVVSAIVAVAMFAMGFVALKWLVNRAVDNGETFEPKPGDERYIGHLLRRDDRIPSGGSDEQPDGTQTATATEEATDREDLPPVLLALVPIVVILALLNVVGLVPEAALFWGVVAAWIPFYRWLPNPLESAGNGSNNALMAAINTAAVVGFGGVAAETPAFKSAVEYFTNLPGPPLVGAAVSVAALAAVVGSARPGGCRSSSRSSDRSTSRTASIRRRCTASRRSRPAPSTRCPTRGTWSRPSA
jgi:H+/gluconate symporter-like permease